MNDEMFDRARRIVDDARNQTHLREWAEALLAERERAEEAERERDEARRQMQSMVAESLVPAEARCASLEAALRAADDWMTYANGPYPYPTKLREQVRAVLGVQDTPEPKEGK